MSFKYKILLCAVAALSGVMGWFDTVEKVDSKRCACDADLIRALGRSRSRVGWREFSARLFARLSRMCSTLGINERRIATA